MKEPANSTWTPAAWSCCSGMEEKFPSTAPGSELDYLIYNDPLSYADLILNGNPEEYLKNVVGGHGSEDLSFRD